MNVLFKKKNYVIAGISVILICIIMVFTGNGNNKENVPVGKALRGDLEIKLIESGDVYATNSRVITSL